jgi:hypothetical protein
VNSQWREPLISVCVPTHDGRRTVLRELLHELAAQAGDVPGRVEVCVSDNASVDGTAEMVDELSRICPCPLVYERHPQDTGLARNLLAAVALATGRYCWLVGSDDLLAPGALRRACELLDTVPNATGYVVGAVHVDARVPSLRSRALPAAFHPSCGQAGSIEGIGHIYDECGNAWSALSWSLVERDAWMRAAREHADRILSQPIFPQVVILAAMASERPHWGWLPEPLVRQRNATTFLFERSDASQAARWTQIIGGAADAWAAVLGGRASICWRRRMRRLHSVWGRAADIRATKLYERPTLREQARLALTCLRAFWPVGEYWREVLPASLAPVWLIRARYGMGHRQARSRERIAVRMELSGSMPRSVVAGSVTEVEVVVRNEGRRAVLAEGPRSLTIGQRWLTSAGRVIGSDEMGVNDLAALPQSFPHRLPRHRPRRARVALYPPPTAGRYRVELVAHQHRYGWLDEVAGVPSIVGDVDVVGSGAP